MIVAWQFTAWNRLEKGLRPVRVRCDTGTTLVRTCMSRATQPNHTFYETGHLRYLR